jgi:RecB family exonuclease
MVTVITFETAGQRVSGAGIINRTDIAAPGAVTVIAAKGGPSLAGYYKCGCQ